MNPLNPLVKLTKIKSAQTTGCDGTTYGEPVYVSALSVSAIEPGEDVGRYVDDDGNSPPKPNNGRHWKPEGDGALVHFGRDHVSVCESVKKVHELVEAALRATLALRKGGSK